MKKQFLVLSLLVCTLCKAQLYSNGDNQVRPLVKLQSGNVDKLDKVTAVGITYDYTGMGVDAYRAESDYLAHIDKLYGASKDAADKYKANWEKGKSIIYPKRFEEELNHYGTKRIGITGKNNDSSAACILKVKTVFIGADNPQGDNEMIVDLEFTFTDSAGNELARYFCKNAIGRLPNFKFDVESGIAEAYAEAAKLLVVAIKKDRR